MSRDHLQEQERGDKIAIVAIVVTLVIACILIGRVMIEDQNTCRARKCPETTQHAEMTDRGCECITRPY